MEENTLQFNERKRESLRDLYKQGFYVNKNGMLLQGDNVSWMKKNAR